MLPTGYYVVSGAGVSRVSRLNAFDNALDDAGISNLNLVRVSSILPENAVKVKPVARVAGEIVHCVLARADGHAAQTLSAGIAWAYGETEDGERYGLVAEDSECTGERELKKQLRKKLSEMASSRNMMLGRVGYETKTLLVPGEKGYGSAVASLVYVFG